MFESKKNKTERYVKIEFTYLSQPPKKFTFEQPKLKKWIEENSKGKVLNLFAGKTKLNLNETRVDINEEMTANYYMDAYDFVLMAINMILLYLILHII